MKILNQAAAKSSDCNSVVSSCLQTLWGRQETLHHIADSYENVICIRACTDDPFPLCERARLSIKLYSARQALSCADYDVIQVETRRLEQVWAVTTRGHGNYIWIYLKWRVEREKIKTEKARVSKSALMIINPLNKVIEDSRGSWLSEADSVRVNLRRL